MSQLYNNVIVRKSSKISKNKFLKNCILEFQLENSLSLFELILIMNKNL